MENIGIVLILNVMIIILIFTKRIPVMITQPFLPMIIIVGSCLEVNRKFLCCCIAV